MGGRLGGSQAGLFGLFEIGGLSFAMIALSRLARRHPPIALAMIGASLAIAGNAAAYAVSLGVPGHLLCGALAGVGYESSTRPWSLSPPAYATLTRAYAIGNGGAVVFVVAVMLLIPTLGARFGPLGAFALGAIIVLVTAPVMLAFRGYSPTAPTRVRSSISDWPSVAALLILWSSFSLGTAAIWSFAERIGRGLHLQPATIGLVLSSATAFGVLGTIIAAIAAGRVPRLAGLAVGLIGTGVACLTLGYSVEIVSYAIGVGLYWIFYMFQYSVFLGAAAALDRTGKAGTLGAGCDRLAFAVGAPVGGLVADHLPYSALGILALASCVVTLPFCLPFVRRGLQRTSGGTGGLTPVGDGRIVRAAP